MQDKQPVKEQPEHRDQPANQKLSWDEYKSIVNDALKEGGPICHNCE